MGMEQWKRDRLAKELGVIDIPTSWDHWTDKQRQAWLDEAFSTRAMRKRLLACIVVGLALVAGLLILWTQVVMRLLP